MKHYDATTVASALPYGPLIDHLREAFASDVEAPSRHQHDLARPARTDATLLLMPAWHHAMGLGIKVVVDCPDNAEFGLPSVQATYLLLDPSSGTPLATMDGTELTRRRTAAVSALAADLLASPDSDTLLMVGTGALASHLIRAHASVRNITHALVWGRRFEAAQALARELRIKNVKIEAVEDLQEAVRTADIVSCATMAESPLIRGSWLRPGAHLDLVGSFKPTMREADELALQRADRVVVDTPVALQEAGEFAGQSPLVEVTTLRDQIAMPQSPRSRDAVTVFKSVGTALADLAAARMVHAIDDKGSA